MPIKNTISRQLHNTNAEEIVQMPASVPVPNVISTKPYKAFWTSTYKGKVNGKPMSDWTQWAGENQMLKQNNFILTPKSKVKLLEINTADEFDRVKKVQKDFGIMQRYVIDFAWYYNHGFDGIHVTWNAIAETRWNDHNKMGLDYCSDTLTFWDTECTCWFNLDWVKKIERI